MGLPRSALLERREFGCAPEVPKKDRKATSLEKVLGRSVEQKEVAPRIAKHLGEVLGVEMKEATKRELMEKLEHAEQAVMLSA